MMLFMYNVVAFAALHILFVKGDSSQNAVCIADQVASTVHTLKLPSFSNRSSSGWKEALTPHQPLLLLLQITLSLLNSMEGKRLPLPDHRIDHH